VKGVKGGVVPPDPKLGFTLDVETKDDKCEVKSGIPKEKGLEAQGID
jgi:hypothetical protein